MQVRTVNMATDFPRSFRDSTFCVKFCALKQLLLCWVVFLIITPGKAGYTWSPAASWELGQPVLPPPEFEQTLARELDAVVGETVLLPCVVRGLGDKVVSWIRKRDLQILTSGPYTFTSDNRFEVVHQPQDVTFWGLRIRGVRITDTGQYECQVNTDPKMNRPLNFTVRAKGLSSSGSRGRPGGPPSPVHIRGPTEQYVREGSAVTFTCEVTQQLSGAHRLSPRGPAPVRWSRDKQELSAQSIRGGISIDTEYWDRKITSKLTVTNLTMQDGGLYTCFQSNSRSATVSLIVVEGEHTEAMQRDAAYASGQTSTRRRRFDDHIFLFCYYIFCIYLNV